MSAPKQQPIIPPIATELLKAELKEQYLLRKTNRAANLIYTFRGCEMPNVMRELGRLREEAFRYYGGGSGKEVDIDELDLASNGYRQLIVWDPVREEIIGGYRYMLGKEILFQEGQPRIASAELFHFTDDFCKEYLPHMIELGRSFVRTDYQQARLSPKSIFALDNLWDGLGALCMLYPEYEYFFGKVTVYKEYNRTARDLIMYYLDTHFQASAPLLSALNPPAYTTPASTLRKVITGKDMEADYKKLNSAVRHLGVNIPPLLNAYMGLTKTMKTFGASVNNSFSDVEEIAILVPVLAIEESKKKRHMDSFIRDIAPFYQRTLKERLLLKLKR